MFLRDRLYEIFHLYKYIFSNERGKSGCIVMSVDFEMIHKHLAEMEIEGFKSLLEFSGNENFPMTFAVVGKLAESNPQYLKDIRTANERNEICSHSYSHKTFSVISEQEAEKEVKRSKEVLNMHGINPVSFVFPKNMENHLSVLKKYGFKGFRGFFGKDLLTTPKKTNSLWDIHQSLFVFSKRNPFLLKKLAEIALRKRLILHIWCHPYNWGEKKSAYDEIYRVLKPLKDYSKKSGLGIKTMKEIINESEKYNY